MTLLTRIFSAAVAAALIQASAAAESAPDLPRHSSIQSDIASIVKDAYSTGAPGAAVIVVRDGNVLYRAARGLANLELNVPLKPDSVFRIGSITKQFTAASILMLAEEGKLSLSDPITKFFPDYPTQGHTVTIENLLAHTSGIRDYTELPEWQSIARNDVTVQQLIDIFKSKPFDFSPGERWKYDNSGYVLLGALIEKLSGQTYADFLAMRIFSPLGMKNSRYEELARITPGRAAGYMRENDEWRNADYLSMSQPYSAGSIISTIDDLARWNAAIEAGELLRPESWERACSSFVLADGTPTRYGAGWIIGRLGPVATVEHGGGINGFNAYVLRVPAQHLYVAVLANASPPVTAPQDVATRIAARVIGVSMDAPEVPRASDELNAYVGDYAIDGGTKIRILQEGGRLFVKDGGAGLLELIPTGQDLFEVRANKSRYQFARAGNGITALERQPRILMGDRAHRIDKP